MKLQCLRRLYRKSKVRLSFWKLYSKNVWLNLFNSMYFSRKHNVVKSSIGVFNGSPDFFEFILYTLVAFGCVNAFYNPNIPSVYFWFMLPLVLTPQIYGKIKLLGLLYTMGCYLYWLSSFDMFGFITAIGILFFSFLIFSVNINKLVKQNRKYYYHVCQR